MMKLSGLVLVAVLTVAAFAVGRGQRAEAWVTKMECASDYCTGYGTGAYQFLSELDAENALTDACYEYTCRTVHVCCGRMTCASEQFGDDAWHSLCEARPWINVYD